MPPDDISSTKCRARGYVSDASRAAYASPSPEPCINRVWPMTFRLLFDGRHFRSISLEKYMAGVRGVAQNVAKQAIGYLFFQLTNADSYGKI